MVDLLRCVKILRRIFQAERCFYQPVSAEMRLTSQLGVFGPCIFNEKIRRVFFTPRSK